MNHKITIISEGLDESTVLSALEAIPDLKLKKVGQDRGLVEGTTKAIKFVAEFVGGSTKVADGLLEQATKQLAGATVKIKFGEIVVEVTNANRSQVIEILDKASEISRVSSNL